MKQYLELVREVLEKGTAREDRTGVGTISIFGMQKRFDLRQGFPLLTTKKMHFRSVLHELLWFLSGDTNIKYLVDNKVGIWNEWPYQVYLDKNGLSEKYPKYSSEWKKKMKEFVERIRKDNDFAAEWGELGPVYGKQWRRWEGPRGEKIDQLQNAIDIIKNKPHSRRILVSGWNVADIQRLIKEKNAAPPLCHTVFQFYVDGKNLDIQLYQRSADIALGVPFNIAGYSALLSIIASECDLKPRYFIHTFGDAHIYKNHIKGLKNQLTRKPYPLPTLKIAKKPWRKLRFGDFELKNYRHHDAIKFDIAV